MTITTVDLPLPPGVAVRVEPRPGMRAEVHVDGWSHSFHAAPMTFEVDLALHLANGLLSDELTKAGMDPAAHRLNADISDDIRKRMLAPIPEGSVGDVLTSLLLITLDPILDWQRHISDSAAYTKIAAPMPWPVPRPHDLEVGHLMMARGHVAALVKHHGDAHGALRAIQRKLFDALSRQGNEVVTDALVADPDDRDETCWCNELGPWFEFDVPVGDATLRGSNLMLHRPRLPETIVGAMEGRRLGDVIETGLRQLDDLGIGHAETEGEIVDIYLDDEWDPLREHDGISDLLG